MKRFLAMLLVLSLLLCGCGLRGPEPYDPPTETTEPSTEATEPPTQATEPPTEATTPPVLYRNPLNGEPLDAPWSGQITAVMINNLKKALPQCGISQADIYYEIEVEGDITRCLAVFSDVSKAGVIGPVRSARTAYNSVAVSYDAPLVHCGGSPGLALAGRYGDSYDTIANWEHIDQAYNGSYFYRDTDRYNSGYAWEHTLFTKGELLQKALDAKGYNTPTDKTFGLIHEDDVVLGGETANQVIVKFKGGKTSTLTYDAETGLYRFYQYNQDIVDANTGKVVAFKNVIVIYTDQWYASDGMHKFYKTIGSGEGYAAINGEIVPIQWNREGLRTSYTYTLADGTPLTLDVGTTYVALVGTKHPISYE